MCNVHRKEKKRKGGKESKHFDLKGNLKKNVLNEHF